MIYEINKTREYLNYLEKHYNNVQKAWIFIKSKCPNDEFRFLFDDYVHGLIDIDVVNHDKSKLSSSEFIQYREWFFPCEGEAKDKESFNKAWEHHKANNVHHWQNWTKDKDNPYADAYVIMMIIDWVAMSYEFGDTAKDYYESNKSKIDLPEWAVELMYKVFSYLY